MVDLVVANPFCDLFFWRGKETAEIRGEGIEGTRGSRETKDVIDQTPTIPSTSWRKKYISPE